ncbi:hypothetical protein R1sor_019547 [Riccia sorocarpa]|uniref:Uncharacterized protein n=1 Tax=Riccia sorocarpa TaxID=122646 RepID=A0ABD3IGM0_9MARC
MRMTVLKDLTEGSLNRLRAPDKMGTLPDDEITIQGPATAPMAYLESKIINTSSEDAKITDKRCWKWANEGTWNTLKECYTQATGTTVRNTYNMPELLEDLVSPGNLAVALLFVSYSKFTWKNRCKAVYEGKIYGTPASAVAKEAARNTKHLGRRFTSTHRISNLQKGIKDLQQVNMNIHIDRMQRRRERHSPEALFTPQMLGSGETSDESEDRRTDRTSALEGRSPRERPGQTTPEGQEDCEGKYSTGRGDRVNMLRELEILRFREFDEETVSEP